MSKLLALDQSSHITGWAIFEDNKLSKYGKIELKDEDIGERLYQLRETINKLIDDNKIDEVVFEDIQLQENIGNNIQTFKILAEVFGVIYELLTEKGIPNTSVLAVTWKSVLGIKGSARAEQKRKAQQYVIDTYGVKASQDESDAICIGTYSFTEPPVEEFNWS